MNDLIFAAWCRTNGLPLPTPEYRFHPDRRWRFDFAWEKQQVAVEVQGGIWTRGRHTRGAALLKEWEKLNTAATLGWRILYCQPDDLLTTQFMATLKQALIFLPANVNAKA
jgi:hypothetical protein